MTKNRFLLAIAFLMSFSIVAQKTKESIYKSNYEQITKNNYTKTLLSLSTEKPPAHIDYKGLPITLKDSSFLFDEKPIEQNFPTQFAENHYLPFYFSAKAYKMPTAMSLLNYYKPIIDTILKKYNLPKELNLIPLVCSGFNPSSSNGIGGEGFWHIYYPQAIKYGLRVDEYIDERSDFNKSTEAAAHYLKDLYNLFNDWELTLAAYSCGVVNVKKAMLRTKKKDYKSIYSLLPAQTNDFVNAYVAMLYLSYYDDFELVKLNPIFDADTVFIEKRLEIKALVDVIKADSNNLLFLNPELIKKTIPKNTVVKFPKQLKVKFYTQKDSVYFYQDSVLNKPKIIEKMDSIPAIEEGEYIVYEIKMGDVLGIIAEKHNVSVTQLQSWNNLSGSRIDIGQQLKIYGTAFKQDTAPEPIAEKDSTNTTKKEPVNKPQNNVSTSFSETYTVKSGDNLWIIAKKFPGVSANDIMKFNNIDANLKIGQKLKIPSK